MTEAEILAGIAGILMIGSYIPYVGGILFQGCMPTRATWLVWAALDWMISIGMYTKGTLNAQVVGATIGATTVALLSLRYGTKGWKPLDIACIVCAAIGGILWAASGDARMSLIACSIAMFAGAVPTFISAGTHPERENRIAWLVAFASCVIMLVSMRRDEWQVSNALQPITFTVIETIMMYLVWVRARKTGDVPDTPDS